MDLNMQSKLLRALQEREVTRLGSNKLVPLDVRIIVATHRDLQKEVKAGNFREDLYYRLLGISIDLPPLSDRGNDIILLARTFTTDFCVENKLQKKDFTQEAIDKLLKYAYPGNVRELKAVVEIASVMSDGNLIKDTDIQFNERTDVEDLLQENLTLVEFNAKIIRWNLKKFNNNVLKVAERLDIGKSTIYRMMKEGKI
jgi:DNA-binding NtrC family response regulator